MFSSSIKMRCFNVGCGHELVLPDGTTILIDPYFPSTDPERSKERVEGADYVLVTHTHYDHDLNLGWISKKFNSRIVLPAVAALAEAKYQGLTYDSLFPAFPNTKFTFPEFSLEIFQAKHNTLGAAHYCPDRDVTFEQTGIKGDPDCDALGGIFSLDYLITTNNGFRIFIASGQNMWEESISRCHNIRPNLLLRQCSVRPLGQDISTGSQVSAADLAKLFTRYNAQLLVPFHMDTLLKKWSKKQLDDYFAQVAVEVERLDPGAAFLAPEAWKWYQIGIGIL